MKQGGWGLLGSCFRRGWDLDIAGESNSFSSILYSFILSRPKPGNSSLNYSLYLTSVSICYTKLDFVMLLMYASQKFHTVS